LLNRQSWKTVLELSSAMAEWREIVKTCG
jgi:hypothetical protein